MTNIHTDEIQQLHPSDLAEQVSLSEGKDKVLSFLVLPTLLKTEVFSYLDGDKQEGLMIVLVYLWI